MTHKNPTEKNGNNYFQIVFISVLILASLVYFGNFWVKALKNGSNQSHQDVLATQEVTPPDQPSLQDVPNKTEKPVVELFVMSFCPYGNLAEDTMYPVVELLGDKIELNVRYVVSKRGDKISSLHGEPEVLQDQRELCVDKLYGKDMFWKFIIAINSNCGTTARDSSGKITSEAGSCWLDIAKELGINIDDLNNCVSNEGEVLLSEHIKITKSKNVSGSPTLFINDYKDQNTIYKYGDSESYKDLICSAFINPPEECDIELGSTSSNTGGSCN